MESMQESSKSAAKNPSKSVKKKEVELSELASMEWQRLARESKTKEETLKRAVAKLGFLERQRAQNIAFQAEREVKDLTTDKNPSKEVWETAKDIASHKVKLYNKEIKMLKEIVEKVN